MRSGRPGSGGSRGGAPAAFHGVPQQPPATMGGGRFGGAAPIMLPPSLPEPMWIYKDPHGNIQGPFNPAEMLQWFEAGYFPNSLLVKQTTDEYFEELGAYMDRFGGRVQFHIPSIPPQVCL